MRGGHSESGAVLAARNKYAEREQAEAARLLHDEVGQLLSAAGLQLELLRLDLDQTVPDIGKRTVEIQATLNRAIEHVRDLTYQLNPSIAERAGLPSALEHAVRRLRARTGVDVALVLARDVQPEGAIASALLRLAVDSVELAVLCGGRSVSIDIQRNERAYVLEVLYDGSSPNQKGGHGPELHSRLLCLQDHAARVGAGIQFASAPGGRAAIRSVYKFGHPGRAS